MEISSLYEKEIISINDGTKLGEIYDVEIDEATGKILSIILCGKWNFIKFFRKRNNRIIPWECVRVIGEETVLVDSTNSENYEEKRKRSFISTLID